MENTDNSPLAHNPRDLNGAEAVKKIKELVHKTSSCFFCTVLRGPDNVNARPMAVQKVDDDGTLWLLSAADSHKNGEINENPAVHLYFQGSPHSQFMHLYGGA